MGFYRTRLARYPLYRPPPPITRATIIDPSRARGPPAIALHDATRRNGRPRMRWPARWPALTTADARSAPRSANTSSSRARYVPLLSPSHAADTPFHCSVSPCLARHAHDSAPSLACHKCTHIPPSALTASLAQERAVRLFWERALRARERVARQALRPRRRRRLVRPGLCTRTRPVRRRAATRAARRSVHICVPPHGCEEECLDSQTQIQRPRALPGGAEGGRWERGEETGEEKRAGVCACRPCVPHHVRPRVVVGRCGDSPLRPGRARRATTIRTG